MLYSVIIGLIILGITAGLIVLKTQATLVFFVLLAGTVLAGSLNSLVVAAVRGALSPTEIMLAAIQVGLVFLPATIVALLCKGSAGRQLPMQAIPALLTGVNAVFLVAPLIPLSLQTKFTSSQAFVAIQPYEKLVLAAGFVTAIIVFGIQYHHKHEE